MRRLTSTLVASAVLVVVGAGGAANPPTSSASIAGAPSTSTSTSTSSAPSVAPSTSAMLPAGHPSMDGPPIPAGPLGSAGEQEGALPPGHPTMGGDSDANAAGQPQLPEIPQDRAQDDPSLAAGTIAIQIVDEKNQPVPHTTVTLGILRQSVAQGEARTHKTADTDAQGLVVFDGLQAGSGWAYRVSITASSPDGSVSAKYGAQPFMLPLDHGYRVQLHRFPVSASIDGLMLAIAGVDTAIEVRDDVVEISQTFDVINVGLTTWALGKDGITLGLPPTFKGLRSPETMQDTAVVGVDGVGARWTGAFPPGQSQITYDYKLPYDGEPSLDFDLEMPPRVLAAAIRIAARRDMTLSVDGFPDAQIDTSGLGVHVLSTQRRGDPQDQIKTLHVHIKGLPTQGPDRWIAAGLGLAAVVAGLGLTFLGGTDDPRKGSAAARARRRKRLLADLVDLETAHRQGDIGPVTYERERGKLIDAIADTLDPIEEKPKKLETFRDLEKRARTRSRPRRRAHEAD